jgi:putative hydrolases of HD superfamily
MEKGLAERTPNFELKYAKLAPEVWEALKSLPRTGWVRRGVENCESVQDHILALRKMAMELLENSEEFSETEKEELVNMLEVHDWPEALVGDQVIVTYDQEEKKRLKAEKFKAEYEAMVSICTPLDSDGETIMNAWLRFERAADPLAMFAQQIDKYQPIEQAFEYESRGETVSTQEFIDYAETGLTHPLIQARLSKVKRDLAALHSK